MNANKKIPSGRETVIAWTVITALAAVGLGIFLKQFYYDPTVLNPKQVLVPGTVQDPSNGPAQPGISNLIPPKMISMSSPEAFGPENLSDKINGKAELYLSAGFVGLRCQRFALKADPKAWMEVYIYDMAGLRQAFAVFSMQRREGAVATDLTPFSYQTKNALFFVHGRYYVEIIASMASGDLIQSMQSFGKGFVNQTSTTQERLEELAFFPKDHLEEATITLSVSDAFGFHGMKNVFTGRYHVGEEELTAFITRTESPENAKQLVEAYQAFLVENGGAPVPSRTELNGAVLIKIFDTFELFFRRGAFVAGVHEAETQQGAERLAAMLANNLDGLVE